MRDRLPRGHEQLAARLTYPLAWVPGRFPDFNQWRTNARAHVFASLQAPPPAAPFAPRLVAEQDRGTYLARKVNLAMQEDTFRWLDQVLDNGRGATLDPSPPGSKN